MLRQRYKLFGKVIIDRIFQVCYTYLVDNHDNNISQIVYIVIYILS